MIIGSAWNPANMMASLIETVHIATGTPWPLTIALFTVGLRAALFPFTVIQTRGSVLANNLRPEVDKLRSESMEARQAGNMEKARERMREMGKLMKANGIGVGRLLGLGLLPVPFFMSTFFALQKMTGQHLPSMMEGGALWFPDLCASDPYYILPVLTTLSLLSTIEVLKSLDYISDLIDLKGITVYEPELECARHENVHAHHDPHLYPCHGHDAHRTDTTFLLTLI